MKTAAVNRIIPFSCVDGPGNRMAIFFQNCSFRCATCHNPETITPCSSCGICVPVCPAGALSTDDTAGVPAVRWNSSLCTGCDSCIAACPSLSTPKTTVYSSGELAAEITSAAAFLDGITCSGGECLLQAGFLEELFEKIKAETDLSCLVDTNGGRKIRELGRLTELTDGFMLDVKAWLPEEHQKLTGAPVEPVIDNLKFLLEAGKLHEVRTVIVPGLDNLRTVTEVSRLVGQDIVYKLIPYHSHGVRAEGISAYGSAGPDEAELEKALETAVDNGALRAEIVRIPD